MKRKELISSLDANKLYNKNEVVEIVHKLATNTVDEIKVGDVVYCRFFKHPALVLSVVGDKALIICLSSSNDDRVLMNVTSRYYEGVCTATVSEVPVDACKNSAMGFYDVFEEVPVIKKKLLSVLLKHLMS